MVLHHSTIQTEHYRFIMENNFHVKRNNLFRESILNMDNGKKFDAAEKHFNSFNEVDNNFLVKYHG